MHWLWVMIVGAAVGAFAGAIMSPSQSRGWIGHIIAGVLGALIGEGVLGPMGPGVSRNDCDTSRNRCNCRRSDNDVRGSVGTGSTVKTQLNSAN